ncbi:MAG: outer membrane protein TolC [Roseivirga sp.]|jgi:outer membrane protein TolC
MKRLIIISILSIIWSSIHAQIDRNDLAIDKIKPLDTLIQLAINKAPLIKRLGMGQLQMEQEMIMTKKEWMQYVALTAGYNYGTGVISDQLTTSTDNQATFITRQNAIYGIGISLRLPLSAISVRKNKIKVNELAIEEIEYQKDDLKKMITEEVIIRYKELSLTLKTMKLQNDKVETNATALEIAENYFKAGSMDIDEYRTIVDITTTAKINLEKVKSEVWYNLKSLEQLVGQSITK